MICFSQTTRNWLVAHHCARWSAVYRIVKYQTEAWSAKRWLDHARIGASAHHAFGGISSPSSKNLSVLSSDDRPLIPWWSYAADASASETHATDSERESLTVVAWGGHATLPAAVARLLTTWPVDSALRCPYNSATWIIHSNPKFQTTRLLIGVSRSNVARCR